MTYLTNSKGKISGNNTGYSDQDIKNLLVEYYRLKLNPEIKMQGYLLENLGFAQCRHCSKERTIYYVKVEEEDGV